MQQRRLRLGDILDDYCPRERRVTNHAIVAIVEDEVKQTRCTTCDSDHEYKQARVPPSRRKKSPRAEDASLLEAARAASALSTVDADEEFDLLPEATQPESEPEEVQEEVTARPDDDWPVHRPLIRATLPRPEGQQPERKAPDFSFRQTGGRFDRRRNGSRRSGKMHAGQSQGNRQGDRHGNRHDPSSPHRGNRQGHGSGQRSGSGRGRGRNRGR